MRDVGLKIGVTLLIAVMCWLCSCDSSEKATAPKAERIEIPVRSSIDPNGDLSMFYMTSFLVTDSFSAVVTLKNASGSELLIPIRWDSDSLVCPMTGVSWVKWVKCVSHWMDNCEDMHPGGGQEFWECCAAAAVGCALGVMMVDWARFIVCPWNF